MLDYPAMQFLVRETLSYLVEAVETGDAAIIARKAGGGMPLLEHSSYVAMPYNVTSIPTPAPGPGTELRNLLAKLGLHPAPNCKCGSHIREMNEKGIEWCSQNIDTIAGWLKEEAGRAGLPFSNTGAKIMIRRAIRNAKKELLTSAHK